MTQEGLHVDRSGNMALLHIPLNLHYPGPSETPFMAKSQLENCQLSRTGLRTNTFTAFSIAPIKTEGSEGSILLLWEEHQSRVLKDMARGRNKNLGHLNKLHIAINWNPLI